MTRMVDSRAKGVRAERELARLLSDAGFPARRGQQRAGGADSPDVVCPTLPFHFEVKRTERLRIHEAMAQARRDADGQIPVVVHRRSREPWLAVIALEDLLQLLR